MARSIEQIPLFVESLRRANSDRDQRQRDVHDVRSGDIDTVIPGSMPDAWPKPIVANLIDTSARDMAEVMGVMPSVNCSNGILTTDSGAQARVRADPAGKDKGGAAARAALALLRFKRSLRP